GRSVWRWSWGCRSLLRRWWRRGRTSSGGGRRRRGRRRSRCGGRPAARSPATWRGGGSGGAGVAGRARGGGRAGGGRGGGVGAGRFLEESGFAAAEVAVSATETETQFKLDEKGNETHQIDGYQMDRTFTVTTGRVADVARASAEVTRLLQENVQVFSGAPS